MSNHAPSSGREKSTRCTLFLVPPTRRGRDDVMYRLRADGLRPTTKLRFCSVGFVHVVDDDDVTLKELAATRGAYSACCPVAHSRP